MRFLKILFKILLHILSIGFIIILFALIFNEKFVFWTKEHFGGAPESGYLYYWFAIISLVPFYLLELSETHRWFNFLKYMAVITAIPYAIFQLIKPIVDIVAVNFFSFLLIGFLAYIPLLVSKWTNFQLSYPGKLYLVITGITIWTHLLLHKLNTFGLRITSTNEEYGDKKLSEKKEALLKHSINNDRISVVFYVCFFMVLIIYNVVTIVFKVDYDPKYDIGKTLIACVATYTAFEKIAINISKFKFSIRKFFNLYIGFLKEKYSVVKKEQKFPKFP
ncbi:hypothetical protein D3C87_32480 [compost metagenome]